MTKSLFRLQSRAQTVPEVDHLAQSVEAILQIPVAQQSSRELANEEPPAGQIAPAEIVPAIGELQAYSDPFAAVPFAATKCDPVERRLDWRMDLSIKVSVLRVSKERLPLPQILDEMLTHLGSPGEALDVSFSGCAVAVPIRWLPGERLAIRLMAAQSAMGTIDAVAVVVRATDLGRGKFKLVCRFQAPLTASQLERLSWSAQDPWTLPTGEESVWPSCDANDVQSAWASAFDKLMRHEQTSALCEV